MENLFFQKHKPKEVLANPKLQAQFLEGLTRYIKAGVYDDNGMPLTYEEGRKYLEAKLKASVATNAPSFITQPTKPKVVRIDELLPEIDTRYLKVFNTVKSDSEVEIYQKVNYGIKISRITEGEEIEFVSGIKGERIYVENITWAAGIRIPRMWFEDNKVYKISDLVANAKREFLINKAGFFYKLLKAQNYEEVDIKTNDYKSLVESLNDAYAKLKRKAKRDIVGKTIYIICSPEKAGLFEAAKRDLITEAVRLRFNYEIIDTVYFDPDEPPVMTLGKTDQYYQLRQGLRADQDFKIKTQEIEIVFTKRFNGVILSDNYGLKLNLK